ncbi:MAG: hypothetical protein AAB410_00160 [Patescibacteria group bacterium]
MDHLNNVQETRPEINTAGLRQQLAAQKGRIAGLVPTFRKDSGFLPLFATVVFWLSELWTRFENSACTSLTVAARNLREAIRLFNPAGHITGYRLTLDASLAYLREQLYTILTRKFERDQARGLELAQLTEQRPILEDAIWSQKIRMSGDQDAVIHHVNYLVHGVMAAFVFLMLIAVEGMAGYGMFEFEGTSYSALAWSLITVVVLALTSHFAGVNRAIINANEDAHRIYAQKCAGGCFDMNGNPVYVTPVEESIWMMARWSERTLLGWSFILVAFRVVLAVSNPKEFGWNAVFGSVAMAVLAGVYYLAEVRHAPKYAKEHQQEFERLVADYEAMGARISELSTTDPNDPYPQERENAIRIYNEAADNAAAVVANDCSARRELAALYLSLVEQYLTAFELVRRAFHALVQEAANAVAKVVPSIDIKLFDNADATRELDELFSRSVLPTLNDADLTAEAEKFDPRVDLPADARVTNFAPVEAETLAQVQTEAAQAASSGAMIFRWNNPADGGVL